MPGSTINSILEKDKVPLLGARPKMPRSASSDDDKNKNILRSVSPPKPKLTEPEAAPATKDPHHRDAPIATEVRHSEKPASDAATSPLHNGDKKLE